MRFVIDYGKAKFIAKSFQPFEENEAKIFAFMTLSKVNEMFVRGVTYRVCKDV